MKPVHACAAGVVGAATAETSSLPSSRTMSPPELTPLIPPGQFRPASPVSPGGATAVPGWRVALFDRVAETVQHKLAERRVAGGVEIGLSADTLRDCDTAVQWVSAHLMAAGER